MAEARAKPTLAGASVHALQSGDHFGLEPILETEAMTEFSAGFGLWWVFMFGLWAVLFIDDAVKVWDARRRGRRSR